LDALLTYEDRWFRLHPGINPVALLRAGWQWLRSGRIVSGGSTLSMQVARIIDGHDTRSGLGKLRQMARALQLEARLSKDQILQLDRKSTRLNSSHVKISYAVFCLKKKK